MSLTLTTRYPLGLCFHSHGVNFRYMGRVRSSLTNNTEVERYWKFHILVEMLTRTIKQHLRQKLRNKMRETKETGEEPYKRMIIQYLNVLFGDIALSTTYWQEELKQLLVAKFEMALSEEESKEDYPFKQKFSEAIEGVADGKCLLFTKICAALGLSFSPSAEQAFGGNPSVYLFQKPFDETDLEHLDVCVKQMNIAQHSEGFALKLKAIKRSGEESARLLGLAIDKFKHALASNSNNKVTLRNLADCLMFIGEFENAEFYFKQALDSDPTDTNTLFKYACFLEQIGRIDDAEDYYLKSLESDFMHSNCLTLYADFLASIRRRLDDAEKLYQCAIEADDRNTYALNNYACLLLFKRKNVAKAEEYFKKAIEVDKEKHLHIQNFATFEETVKNDYKKAKELYDLGDEVERSNLARSSTNEILPQNVSVEPVDYSSLTKAQKRNLRRKKNNQKKKAQKEQQEAFQSFITLPDNGETIFPKDFTSESDTDEEGRDLRRRKERQRRKQKGIEKARRRSKSDATDTY